MKVVLFCGGLGTRLREYSDTIPKPLVPIGDRPIIWNVMKYYAAHGHTDFILCLGYKGLMIKEYFMGYREWTSNDFRMRGADGEIELFQRDLDDWTITFVDTGLTSNIGQRLSAIEPYLGDDEVFLANYSDGLADVDFTAQMDQFRRTGAVASFIRVHPSQTFHTISCDDEGFVNDIRHVGTTDTWINGGFFILRRQVFDYLQPGEELVEQPFHRLAAAHRLVAFRHDGFFAAMDTFKEKKRFDELYESNQRPWEVWNRRPEPESHHAPTEEAPR